MIFSKILSYATLITVTFGFPLHVRQANNTSGNNVNQVQIKVINQCSYDLTIAKLTNEQSKGEQATVKVGRQKVYPLPSNWQGRFFGRKTCSGVACTIAGASEAVPPASLAEFTFRGWGGIDYYDISLVDGFNLPLKITPINGSGSDASEKYKCGSPSCKSLPTCAKEFQVLKNGKFDSCLSACSKFNTDEYCCRGAFGTPDKCVANQYSKSVKAVCPDAYSFAYDDQSSTYSCVASGYAITFCP